MFRSTFLARATLALALAVALISLSARGETIVLKDGFTLHGTKIIKEKTTLFDEKAMENFVVDVAGGVWAIDDGPRWVVFPRTLRQLADVTDANKFKDLTGYTRERYKGQNPFPETIVNPAKVVKDWDFKEWTREIQFKDSRPEAGVHTIKQHVNLINPYYLRVGSSSHRITRYFLTREFPPDMIRKFLETHPDIDEMGKPNADKRERLVRFWIQADLLDEADKDLERLLADLPNEQKRHAGLRAEVVGLRAEQLVAEIERAKDAGRHEWAKKALQEFAKFPKAEVPKGVATKALTLRAEYETLFAKFEQAKTQLAQLAKKVPAADQFLTVAAKAVRDELHPDTVTRLDQFTTLAELAERATKSGKNPAQSPTELLSSAVTGWHLGKVSAEPKLDIAYKCWKARLMAQEYLQITGAPDRVKFLAGYLALPHALKYDELEKLVSLLPPPDAPNPLPIGGTFERSLPPIPAIPQGLNFTLQLPEEYQPGRSYPLIILLRDKGERTIDLLARLGDLPSRNGYIVAVPQWLEPMSSKYEYTPAEREKIQVLLRHLRRAYQVDSDRVNLIGNGEGGAFALDLGACHPDTFAAIVPVNPPIVSRVYITCHAWVNFIDLPVYLIMGDRAAPSVPGVRALNERWMPRGFPTLVTSYKGRDIEWFAQEWTTVFDWMGRKRRAEPGKTLGPPQFGTRTDGPGFTSVRSGPNRFHWLSSENISPARQWNPILGGTPPTSPARFSAEIKPGNAVAVRVAGMSNVTVWFGKGMLDYTKPVKVQVNGAGKVWQANVVPSSQVLMDDLFERADRQRPYFERVDMKVPN